MNWIITVSKKSKFSVFLDLDSHVTLPRPPLSVLLPVVVLLQVNKNRETATASDAVGVINKRRLMNEAKVWLFNEHLILYHLDILDILQQTLWFIVVSVMNYRVVEGNE